MRPANRKPDTAKPKKKRGKIDRDVTPFPKVKDAQHILSFDPGFNFGICYLDKPTRELYIVGSSLRSRRPKEKLPHVAAEYHDHVHDCLAKLEMESGAMTPGALAFCEYPIPFYQASRESNASVNFMAGLLLASANYKQAQLYCPGNVKGLPVWNARGEGKEEAQAFWDATPVQWLDPMTDARDNVVAEKCGRFTDDMLSALGILLCGLRYNGILMPADITVYAVNY